MVFIYPCRLCPHVVVVVVVICFNNPWGYSVEPLMHAWRVQGEIADQAGHGGLRNGRRFPRLWHQGQLKERAGFNSVKV